MMRLLISILFFMQWAYIPMALAGDILKGFEAYNKGDYSGAFIEWEDLAANGDAVAQSSLGIMYHLGQGVSQDDFKAFDLINRSARQGFAPAQMSLGHFYENGLGTIPDQARAFMWFSIAASSDKSAKVLLELLKAKMTASDINAATALYDQCLKSKRTKC